jgi:hypothetical protein
METITCDAKAVRVKEIEQNGGYLNATTEFTDSCFASPEKRF